MNSISFYPNDILQANIPCACCRRKRRPCVRVFLRWWSLFPVSICANCFLKKAVAMERRQRGLKPYFLTPKRAK